MKIQKTIVVLALVLSPCLALDGIASQGSKDSEVDEVQARGKAYTHLMRAVFATRRGAVGNAMDEIEQAIELQPSSPDLLIEAADLLLWTGRQKEAEDLARRALKLDAEHQSAIRFLADQAGRRAFSPGGDEASQAEARRLYERLAGNEDVDPQVLAILVQLRLTGGDLEGSIEVGRRLVQARPGDREASQTLAQLLAQAGQTDEALEVLIRYLAIHPEEADLFAFVEKQVRDKSAWDRVNEIFTESEPLSRNSSDLHRLHGEARLRLGDSVGAVASLEIASQVSPEGEGIRYFLGLSYSGTGRMADATEVFSSLVEEVPGHLAYQRRLAETLEARGKTDEALVRYQSALQSPESKEDPEVRDELRLKIATLQLGREAYDDVESWLARIENPASARATEIAARLALHRGDLVAAGKASKQLRAAERPGMAALVDAEIAVRQKRWERAREGFERAIEALGPFAQQRAVTIYTEQGAPERGEALLRQWVAESVDSAYAHYSLGVFLHSQDRFDEAEISLRETFRLEPRHAAALNFLGYSLAERGIRLDEALELIRRAVDLDPWNPAFLDSLGWVNFQMERFEEARLPLEQAARELPLDPTILEHLGDLYLRLGQREQALSVWGEALDNGPENPESLREKIRRESAARASTQLLPLRP